MMHYIMTKMSSHDQRRVCVAAPCDPRTLTKYLRGEPVRPMASANIARALRELGLTAPDRAGNANNPAP